MTQFEMEKQYLCKLKYNTIYILNQVRVEELGSNSET